MAPQAWVVAENGEDLQRPREFLPLSKLEDVGVLYWHLDPKKSESEEELVKIRKDRGYSYMDLIEICPDKLENYEEKVKNFFREHMHPDEEIRYCLEGSGYFDVRDKDDKWIRIWIKEGDMIILPAGIYHRFTLDSAKYTKLMRLFIGEPVWTALNRPQEDHLARQEYVKNNFPTMQLYKVSLLERQVFKVMGFGSLYLFASGSDSAKELAEPYETSLNIS
ncbi:unnamed protein product [Miscanthus lutarioriparius]|uniref:Acireductone dioxygenase n=1 Tax=Miscanthus lutarioriparius TaxID=422564 RepID=A0A811MEK1_9POAL|nr:unnamed protein product [Miscanthus lutarioriparius]